MNPAAASVVKVPAVGSPAPRFVARSPTNERFTFETVAGRYLVLCFLGTAGGEHAAPAMAAVQAHRKRFDDDNLALFWITADAADESRGRLADSLPGVRVFWDLDMAVARLWGVTGEDAPNRYAPMWFLVDPQLRVMLVAPIHETAQFFAALADLPPSALHSGGATPAPVLILPRVFEPAFCKTLIDTYQDGDSFDSGFMRQVGGKTVLDKDYAHKRRRDVLIDDESLQEQVRGRIQARLAPEMERCFQFKPTRIERYLIACYAAADQAHFKPHRDNTTTGTAHRRFAVTINLNAGEYEGGDLIFPEFGRQSYRAPTGGAVVFSCSLMHEALPVTKGVRYAFLPFLYDEAAARIREANLETLEESLRVTMT